MKLARLFLVLLLIFLCVALPFWILTLHNLPVVIDTIEMKTEFKAIRINPPEIVPEVIIQQKVEIFPIHNDKTVQKVVNPKIEHTNDKQQTKIDLTSIGIFGNLYRPKPTPSSFTTTPVKLNTLSFNTTFEGDPLIDETSQKIELLNEKAIIRNFNQFKLEDEFIPITIRVYNRTDDFREMIKAISTVRDIKKTILVFSHDIVNKEIFDLIESIDFCQTIQLLHPYSLTFQHDNYSREYLNLPPVNIPIPKKTSAIKHHFWWLTNYVFAKLFPHHNGDIAFLEEDHLVTKDFYQLLKTMRKIREIECKKLTKENSPFAVPPINNKEKKNEADLYGDLYAYFSSLSKVQTAEPFKYYGDCFASVMVELNGKAQEFRFVDITPNVGLSFDRNSWNNVLFHSHFFCTFNDYNWDLTLTVMAAYGMIPRKNLAANFGRVAHLGVCEGMHLSNDLTMDCNLVREQVINMIDYKNAIITNALYRFELENIYAMTDPVIPRKIFYNGFGGWRNQIDWQKCLNVLERVSNIHDVNIVSFTF